jgi:hypothetical protein
MDGAGKLLDVGTEGSHTPAPAPAPGEEQSSTSRRSYYSDEVVMRGAREKRGMGGCHGVGGAEAPLGRETKVAFGDR